MGAYALAATTPGAPTAALDALSFTPTQNQVAVDQTVTTTFTLRATDDQDTTTTDATTSVVATSVNDAPTLDPKVLSYTVAEGQTVQNLYAAIVANARDVDPGDQARITVSDLGLSGTSGMAYLDPARRVLTYTADGYDAAKPTDAFTYAVTDGRGGTSAPGTVAIAVTGASQTTQTGTAGADTLTAAKSGTRLIGGAGDDTLSANAANTLVFAGSGDDTIAVNAAKATIYGGTGTNTIKLGDTAQDTIVLQQGGLDDIYGFNPRSSGQLDLRQVLAEAQIALSDKGQIGTYFGVSTSGTDATLSFNPAGQSAGAGGALAVLHGVGADTTLAGLIGNDVLKIA